LIPTQDRTGTTPSRLRRFSNDEPIVVIAAVVTESDEQAMRRIKRM
jgi:hypothetical protein